MAKEYDYRIVARYPHATTSYTQGLEYVDGVMWEGTGQEGESHLQQIDLATGRTTVIASIDDSEFGEGITHHNGAIYQLTWESHKAYKYSPSGELLTTITYQGEGWGISSDGENLYLSDGSATIRNIDPETFRTLRSICVSYNGRPLSLINELECVGNRIWANVYTTDSIVEIDPTTGAVVGFVNLAPLRYLLEANPEAEVLNGIAYNPTTGNMYVTGKDWNTIFEIEIIR
jgi:glutamine cyclotransferase